MTNLTKISNRLINEKSPYLLQHAYNPVDWWPWSDEAFAKAKDEDKPVFLSIGYSTCHWCHVMAHESFEDKETADYLNENFISIKVDKEERPDIDSIYMNVCQTLTGSGGWPLTIFMTHDQKPFFAGTYFPKTHRYGSISFLQLLSQLNDYWLNKRDDIYRSGEEITRAVSSEDDNLYKQMPSDKCIHNSFKYFSKMFDKKFGGFGSAPKFPSPHNLMFLLRYHRMKPESNALEMVEKTIIQMYKGGIFDHIGYGFSRYSTDNIWLIPHFEKMLYDNALIVIVLSDLLQITGNVLYKNIITNVLYYIENEMTSVEGGFFSAQDADSEGEEGKYYIFSRAEIFKVLNNFPEQDVNIFCNLYDITDTGNFEGKNIPNLINTENISQIDLFDKIRTTLYNYRKNRFLLHKDDKILTSWNAMMIIAYTKTYKATKNTNYLEAAEKALDFIISSLMDDTGNLFISYREGQRRGNGLLEDYAFMIWAYIELYDATFNIEYLIKAIELKNKTFLKFSDESGGFFITPSDGEILLYRPKEKYDGAVPSGNSVMAYCLSQIAFLCADTKLRDEADNQLAFYYSEFTQHPYAYSFALIPTTRLYSENKMLICLLRDQNDITVIKNILFSFFCPNISCIIKTAENSVLLSKTLPFTENYKINPDHRFIFYLCEGTKCSRPFYNIDELKTIFN